MSKIIVYIIGLDSIQNFNNKLQKLQVLDNKTDI